MFKTEKIIDLIYIERIGDVVEALTCWYNQEDVITETSRTFSGQVFDFCKKNKLNTLVISAFEENKQVDFGVFSAYSRPKLLLKGGIGYHLSQIWYGLKILVTVIRYQPKYLHITNGATHWFILAPLKLFGIKIYPHFHNTFWAKGYPPTGKIQRLLLKLDSWFLKHIASAAICCSPEIARQIQEITNNQNCPTYVFKAQFYASSFENSAPPPPHAQKPFVVVFAGRIERNKGVFDVLAMAEKLQNENVIFHICGGGPALDELKNQCKKQHLTDKVVIHGRLNRHELLNIYQYGHVVIVPTRSDFFEGLPMVSIESVLLARPLITSKLSNALDVLGDVIVEAEPENIDSYVSAIRKLAFDKSLYEKISQACQPLRAQFLDGKQGLTEALEHTLR